MAIAAHISGRARDNRILIAIESTSAITFYLISRTWSKLLSSRPHAIPIFHNSANPNTFVTQLQSSLLRSPLFGGWWASLIGSHDSPSPPERILESASTEEQDTRQSDSARLLVVHLFRLRDHIGATGWEICADREAVQRGQNHGFEHNTVACQDGICACGLDLGNEQYH